MESKSFSRSDRADAQNSIKNILETTIKIADEGSLLNIETIAHQANVSTTTVNRHFPSRKDIFQSAFGYLLHKLRIAFQDRCSDESRQPYPTHELARHILEVVMANQRGIHTLLCQLTDPQLEIVLRQHQDHVIKELSRRVNPSLHFGSQADHRERFDVLYKAIEGIILEFVRRDQNAARQEAYVRLLTSCLSLFLDEVYSGVSPKAATSGSLSRTVLN